MLTGLPFGALPDDTAEYMLGDVFVTVVLMESSTQTGPRNNNSETWTSAAITAVKQKVQEGLKWWEDTLAQRATKHELNFQIDFTYADTPVVTSYEPITRPSTDLQFWVYDFLNVVGYNNRGNFHNDIRAFNDAQRQAHDADWAYTVFVVNDENDPDHQFAAGGFPRAFAFAGGELLVSPASRPASTYAHESGHQFWALDEYQPDGNYDRFRGYYNTQNLNSWDNPTPGFQQQPSIMANGIKLDTAYMNHTSAVSTLDMIGWKDSDGDGIFDVLDVPLTLAGSGHYDATAGEYRFVGSSAVQTLPNHNSSGLGNDISINRVSRAQFRIDGGAWQTATVVGTAEANLDLRVRMPVGSNEIEIRTIDDGTGITSPIFRGSLSRPDRVLLPGINGIAWRDQDRDGAVDANEPGLPGVTMELLDQSGQPLSLRKTIEPDDHASTTRLNTISPHVTLSAFGSGVSDDTVAAWSANNASTGSNVFASFSSNCASAGGYCSDWTPESRQMRMDFTSLVSTLSLDAIGSSVAGYARLEVYGANNELLARYTTKQLTSGQVETMTLNRPSPDIKYAIAHGHINSAVRFDNLRFGPHVGALTDSNGTFALPYLQAGTYQVRVALRPGQTPTNPSAGSQLVSLAEGEFKGGVDFGIAVEVSPWQNPNNKFDVSGDGFVAPHDALVVINSLNRDGSRELTAADPTPPFLDVSGDFHVSPIDALQVINQLNRGNNGPEGESSFASAAGWSTPGSSGGEGEPLLDAPLSQRFSDLPLTGEFVPHTETVHASPVTHSVRAEQALRLFASTAAPAPLGQPLESGKESDSLAPVHDDEQYGDLVSLELDSVLDCIADDVTLGLDQRQAEPAHHPAS